jgi:eukaryotic-like serine/threonine-protein kinase
MTEVADNTLVDGRYRIVRRIGSGGMADVYCAEDTHLGREVALKVLHRRFAQDQEFVERFRREASSAAGLQHPNVVGVFDRGEHEGTYYIAMEHLPGRTLKELVREEAPLAQERAIALGVQVLRAAGFAHAHGVIHRDFKAQNVIVDGAGNAKVTDFGIARAGASEMTETGSILGTAQYLSPEQAQGHSVTAASDLYSIAVMLYELLTGRLPFDGDSAVSVALKHLSEPPPPVSQSRPEISPALEAVVMGGLAKHPAHRWQSADEFAAALEHAGAQIAAGTDRGQDTAAFGPVAAPVRVEDLSGNGAPPPPYDPAYAAAEEERRRWPMFTLGLMVLALLGLLVFLALSGLLAGEKVDMPNVVGKQLVQARTLLEQRGFDEITVERQRSLAELDQVIQQSPPAGREASTGDEVTLVVSRGPGNVRVPSVENLPQERAIKELNKLKLKVNLDEVPSDTVQDGFAIRTVPRAGTEVERGTRVRLFVSSGAEQVSVPDVVGQTRETAETEIEETGLEVSVQQSESDQPVGEVVSQSPSPGTKLDRGERVTITVSSGPETVDVPSVVGLPAGQATAQLRAAGLTPVRRERSVSDESQDGMVVEQQPGGGSEADRGDSVVIIVGAFEEEEPPPADELAPEPPPQ